MGISHPTYTAHVFDCCGGNLAIGHIYPCGWPMDNIEVRITETASGDLVDRFTTNSVQLADERIAKMVRAFAKHEPGTELTIQRSDQDGAVA
jgi:hypothetical protein